MSSYDELIQIADAVVATPFYFNWTFWAFFVSCIALTLSQLPPIKIWLKKAKIDLELYSKISLTHKVGNPNLQLHLILTNIGGRNVRVKEIVASLSRDGTKLVSLPAQNYLQKQSDQNTVLFTTFSLSPNQEWGHITNFLKYFERDEEKKYREMVGKIKSDIMGKREEINEEDKKLIEASPDNVAPFNSFFDEKFIWLAGEYELIVKVVTNTEKANIEKSYRFTLFEYHEKELRKITKKYKYGDGIYWDSPTAQSVIVNIKEA